jgi:hypothetical protein
MKLHKGLGLPSDGIRFRAGFDGEEPNELLKQIGALKPSDARVTIAVNTHYPEISGAWFFNHAILELIQDALGSVSLLIVADELFPRDAAEIVPIHIATALVVDETYLLVTPQLEVHGSLRLWEFCGYGGPYYGEDRVVDLVMPAADVDRFSGALGDMCRNLSVGFERIADALPTPGARPSLLTRICQRILH